MHSIRRPYSWQWSQDQNHLQFLKVFPDPFNKLPYKGWEVQGFRGSKVQAKTCHTIPPTTSFLRRANTVPNVTVQGFRVYRKPVCHDSGTGRHGSKRLSHSQTFGRLLRGFDWGQKGKDSWRVVINLTFRRRIQWNPESDTGLPGINAKLFWKMNVEHRTSNIRCWMFDVHQSKGRDRKSWY